MDELQLAVGTESHINTRTIAGWLADLLTSWLAGFLAGRYGHKPSGTDTYTAFWSTVKAHAVDTYALTHKLISDAETKGKGAELEPKPPLIPVDPTEID